MKRNSARPFATTKDDNGDLGKQKRKWKSRKRTNRRY